MQLSSEIQFFLFGPDTGFAVSGVALIQHTFALFGHDVEFGGEGGLARVLVAIRVEAKGGG